MNISPKTARNFSFAATALAVPLMFVANFLWPISALVGALGCCSAAAYTYVGARLLLPSSRHYTSRISVAWRGALIGLVAFVVANCTLWFTYFQFFAPRSPGAELSGKEPIMFAFFLTEMATLWFGWLGALLGSIVGWFNAQVT